MISDQGSGFCSSLCSITTVGQKASGRQAGLGKEGRTPRRVVGPWLCADGGGAWAGGRADGGPAALIAVRVVRVSGFVGRPDLLILGRRDCLPQNAHVMREQADGREGVWTLPLDPLGLSSVQLAARPAAASPSLWREETERSRRAGPEAQEGPQGRRPAKEPARLHWHQAGCCPRAPGSGRPGSHCTASGKQPFGPVASLLPPAATCSCTTLGGLLTTLTSHPDPKACLHLEAGP